MSTNNSSLYDLNADVVSLCSLTTGDELFGIDTRQIREVLGVREVQRVPLAPSYIAGIIPNRGDVLTIVNLRALLGLDAVGASSVVVLEDEERNERFGLVVDSVGGVVMASEQSLEANPGTLGHRCKALFDGVYKMPTGLLIRINPVKLRPSRLAESGLFRTNYKGD